MNYYIKKIKIIVQYGKSIWKTLKGRNKHKFQRQKKYAVIFFAADYNNLGDLAITIAQQNFLSSLLGDKYEIIKINESETYDWVHAIKKIKPENVIITLIGGGNSGSLYEFIENPRRFILKFFKEYTIISFPQTVFFEEDGGAKATREAFSKVAGNCKNLTLVAREKYSEQVYKQLTDTKVLLTPDIVFTYEKYVHNKGDRDMDSVALILRSDKEKAIDDAFQDDLIDMVGKLFKEVKSIDTCDIEYSDGNEQELLSNYLENLQMVRLVITDRLHGMILSYITKTPCIVFDNNNGKIKSTYETWLQNQNIVRLFDATSNNLFDLQQAINEMKECKEFVFDDLNERFDTLREIIEEIK